MAVMKQLERVRGAIINYLLDEPDEKILFVSGGKSYSVKDIKDDINNGGELTDEIINLSVKTCTRGITLTSNNITENVVQLALQMWKK